MSIRSGELREKEDYQKYILERLRDDDSYIIRDASYYVQGLAMDPELLIRFLDTTQPDKMAKLRETYGGKTEAGAEERAHFTGPGSDIFQDADQNRPPVRRDADDRGTFGEAVAAAAVVVLHNTGRIKPFKRAGERK